MIASCVRDDTVWVPSAYHLEYDDRSELEG